jgi:hypothetical protein
VADRSIRAQLGMWLLTLCALVAIAPWDWLPLAVCAPWIAAVAWATVRSGPAGGGPWKAMRGGR